MSDPLSSTEIPSSDAPADVAGDLSIESLLSRAEREAGLPIAAFAVVAEILTGLFEADTAPNGHLRSEIARPT